MWGALGRTAWLLLASGSLANPVEGRCFCSGVANQCREATSYYWATLRLQANEGEHGFKLTDKEQQEELEVEYRPESREVKHQYPRGTGSAGLYYWSLPEKMMGNRVSAYGGNLTLYQRFVYSGEAGVQDADVILVGDDLTLQTQVSNEVASDQELRSRVTLSERGWLAVKDGVPSQATKADVLKVLADLKGILVRGTVSKTMQETMLRKVMMDIAVPEPTGGPPATGLEECRCPPKYRGLSCEECAPGHTGHPECTPMPGLETPDDGRQDQPSEDDGSELNKIPIFEEEAQDPFGRGAPNPYGNQSPVEQDPYGRQNPYGNPDPYRGQGPYRGRGQDPFGSRDPFGVQRGLNQIPTEDPYGGRAPLVVSIDGPKVQSVRPGETVTFDCSAQPVMPLQDPITYGWAKQNGLLPPGRAKEDGFGVLVISSVETDDSGTYVCTVTAGSFQVQESLELDVSEDPSQGGGDPYGRGRDPYQQESQLTISPPYTEVVAGEEAVFECEGGSELAWSRGGGWPMSSRATVSGSRLHFRGVTVEDEGEYVCEGPRGGQPARAQLYVQEAGWPGTGLGRRRPQTRPQIPAPAPRCPAPTVAIEPVEQVVPQGQDAAITCKSTPPGNFQWMKVGEDMNSPQLKVMGERVEVKSALVSDRGMYVCTVTTSCGAARASSILEVEPREAPVVELYPSPQQTVSTGESVLFQCRYLAGIPSPTISWSREDGSALPTSAELLPGGVLRINSVTGREGGEYRCVASNAAGTVQALASLNVQQPPMASLSPSGSVTLNEGRPLNLVCTIEAGDPPPSLSWRKLGDTVESVGTASPTLSLPAVTKEDEGTYACIASNSAGEAEERVQVIVTREQEDWPPQPPSRGRPGMRRRPDGPAPRRNPGQSPGEHEVHTRIGSNVTLNCLTGGEVPAGARAVWTRSAQSRPFSRRHRQRDGLLSIRGVKSSDHGPYMCQLIARDGSVLFELRANLIVKGKIGIEGQGRVPNRPGRGRSRDPFNWGGSIPPTPMPPPPPTPAETTSSTPPGLKLEVNIDPPEQTVTAGEMVEFECAAVALVRLEEPTTLTWVREEGEIPQGRGADNGGGLLQIQESKVEDSGTYICLARSGSYLHQARATLLVTLSPQSPPLLPAFPTLSAYPVPAYQPRGAERTRGFQPSPYQQEDRRQPGSPYQPYQQSPVEENTYADPAKGYQPPVSPYQQAPSKGYQPPVQPYVAPAKGYQPPQSPTNGYQPSRHPTGVYQPWGNPTDSYQPPRSRAPDPHTRYPPVGPSGAALDDYEEGSATEEDEDDGEWYEDPDSTSEGDEDYGNPAPWETAEDDEYYDTRSPIAYSSEDYSMSYGLPTRSGPRQYQPYAGGSWAGEDESAWGGCQAGEVQCGAIEECISVGVLCDGEYDCTNAWDEIDQGC